MRRCAARDPLAFVPGWAINCAGGGAPILARTGVTLAGGPARQKVAVSACDHPCGVLRAASLPSGSAHILVCHNHLPDNEDITKALEKI